MCALVTGVQTCALPIYRIGNLERSDLDQRARDVVGRGGGEELLREARRAEAGRGRSAQRHARHDLEARGDLAVQRVAEIRIMLVAARELERPRVADVAVHLDIAHETVTRDVARVVGAETGEHLRSARRARSQAQGPVAKESFTT